MSDVQVDGGANPENVETPTDVTQVIDPANDTNTEALNNESQMEPTTQERDDQGRFKNPVQKRIDELTRARHESDREAAYWRQLAQTSAQPSSQDATPAKPTVDQFDDYGAYVEALTDWKADRAVERRMEQESTRKVGEVRAQTFQERQTAFIQANPDYVEVMGNSNAPIAKHVIEAAQESDLGPDLLYHFAKNPDVLGRLNQMDERSANREIGRLEATLSNKATAAPAPPAKKLTNTPAPAGTQNTQGRSTAPALGDASMDEYKAQRKAQGARWAR